MDGLEYNVKEDVLELHSHVSNLSSWLPRFLSHLKRYESLPNPTEFPRVVASIAREFKVILADVKGKVPVMKRVESLKGRVWQHLMTSDEGKASAGVNKLQDDSLAVSVQLLELEWERTCILLREIHEKVVDTVKRACVQTLLDESNSRSVSLGDLSDIEEEEEEEEEDEEDEEDKEEKKDDDEVEEQYDPHFSTDPPYEAPIDRRRKFHFAVDSNESVELQLSNISSQMLEVSTAMTSMEPCPLSVVGLELRKGELQVLRTILEVHHSEVTYMLETVSPQESTTSRMVVFALDDLWEKCGALIKHFEETEEQYWEVLELVTTFEEDMARLGGGLRDLGKVQLLTWNEFEQAFWELEDHQPAIASINDLSTQLLTLEPIFNGDCIRSRMKGLAELYNSTRQGMKAALQARLGEEEEAFSCDVAMVRSWGEQSLLLLSHFGASCTDLSERAKRELVVHQEMLTKVEKNLDKMVSVAAQACLPSCTELVSEVKEVGQQLQTIGLALNAHHGDQQVGGDAHRLSQVFSVHFRELDYVIHQMTHGLLQPPCVTMETRSKAFSKEGVNSHRQLPVEMQAEVEGIEGDMQDLGQSVSTLKLPTGVDLEETRSAVDTCRTYQRLLDVLHQRITKLLNQKCKVQVKGLLELELCALSSSWQQISVTLADKLNMLHSREAEIVHFNRQVSQLAEMVEKAEELVVNPPLDLHDFTARSSAMKDEMVAAERDCQKAILKLGSLSTFPSAPESPHVVLKEKLTQRWTQVLQSLEQVSTNSEEVLVRFIRMWEEWAETASEEVESLVPTGCTLAALSSKHAQAQQMRQNAEAILRSLTASPPTEQAKDLSQTLDRLLQESSRLEKVLNSRLSELRVFLTEYSALKSWLNDMNVSAQGEQHAVKRQTLCQQIVLKEKSVHRLQLLTQQLMQQAGEGQGEEPSSELTRLVMRAKDLFDNWDKLCQQCVPAGVVHTGLRREAQPQREFSSPADMIKWLMGVAAKLHPQSQCFSQQQVEDALLDVKNVAHDLASLHANYEQLVGGEVGSTWMANQRDHLSSLWSEVASLVAERKCSLEELDGLWRLFNEQKEKVVEFMRTVELHTCLPSVLGRSDVNLSVIDADIQESVELSEEISQWESEMESLGSLATKLLHYRLNSSEPSELQKVMTQLENRWMSVKAKFATQWPNLEVLKGVWSDYYTSYRRLQAKVTHLKVKVSELNTPPVTTKIIASQKVIMKEILLESKACLEFVDAARAKLHVLTEQTEPLPLHAGMLSERVEGLVQEVEELAEATRAKQAQLEGALLERQQVISDLASCSTWLQHADSLLLELRPVGRDLVDVGRQFRAMQGFWVEFEEQREKICHVLVVGAHLLDEQAEAAEEERNIVELVRMQHTRLSENWGRVQEEAIQAKEALDMTYPAMVHFQSLCTQVGQLLTAAEMQLTSAQPIAQTLPRLRLQAAKHEELQTSMAPIVQHLKDIQQSVKDLKDGGCDLSPDLMNLVKRFEKRWMDVSRYAHNRSVRLNESLSKFGSVPVRDGALPQGWSTEQHSNDAAENSVATELGRRCSTRVHPDLGTTLQGLEAKYSHVKYGNYRVALKVRGLQKRLQLHLVTSRSAQSVLLRYLDETSPRLGYSEVVQVLAALYKQAHSDHGDKVQVGRSVDMATSWIMVTYDKACEGRVSTAALKVGVMLMCGGELDDKLKCVFKVFADSYGEITADVLGDILGYSIKIPQSVGEEEQFPNELLQANQVFERPTLPLKLGRWLSWLHNEPKPLAWVPMIHRLAQSEHCRHDVKCSICRVDPILGFRYRCMQCFGVDLCQDCYWSQRSGGRHVQDHPMQEYCQSPKLTQDIKDFFKVLGRRMTRPSGHTHTRVLPPMVSPPVINHQGMHIRMETMGSEASLSTVGLPQASVAMDNDLDLLIAQLEDENRELAFQLQSVRMQEEDPTASISSQLLSLEESRQALELRIHYLQTQNAKLLTQIDKLKAIVQQKHDFNFVNV